MIRIYENSVQQLPIISNVGSLESTNAFNFVTVLDSSKLTFQNVTSSVPYEDPIPRTQAIRKMEVSKSIYVCTFCQVFSSKESVVTDHIMSSHADDLPAGTEAISFVSKLQALQSDGNKSAPKKVGRKRKEQNSSIPVFEEKVAVPEPVPDSDGLYWCQKCNRSFRKIHHITRHICYEIDSENELSDDSSMDLNNEADFLPHRHIETDFHCRRPKQKSKFVANCPDQHTAENNLKDHQDATNNNNQPINRKNWREDSTYVPLFLDEKEKQMFEEHVKSIDYSFADNLFLKEERKAKKTGKKHHPITNSVYKCVLCQKVFHSLASIRMHCLIHTDIKPFTCPKCPYASNSKGSLYTHMRSHTGNVFQCTKCEFKATKRAHLLDHLETHLAAALMCKLCKNSYKTAKSLIAHVRRYHNNPGGKKYAKALSSKQSKNKSWKCQVCQKLLKSQSDFEMHYHHEHSTSVDAETSDSALSTEHSQAKNSQVIHPQLVTASDASGNFQQETAFAELVLNELLHQKDEGPMDLYDDVFQHSPNSNLLAPLDNAAGNFVHEPHSKERQPLVIGPPYQSPKDVLIDCQKTLRLDILDECFRESDFSEKVIAEPVVDLPSECEPVFGMHGMQLPFQAEPLVTTSLPAAVAELPKDLSHLESELLEKADLNEPKSAEIKLFERCRRAPAYVCCVCSGIFICPVTLKAHLKEHINSNNSLVRQAEEEFLEPRVSESDSAISNVCNILQDSSLPGIDGEKELEKLYSSSMDTLFYLPEVSVVLENDPTLASILDDISNFPIPDKYDVDDLEMKCNEIF